MAIATDPVPAGVIVMLSLLLNPKIVLSVILIASFSILVPAVKPPVNTTSPVAPILNGVVNDVLPV